MSLEILDLKMLAAFWKSVSSGKDLYSPKITHRNGCFDNANHGSCTDYCFIRCWRQFKMVNYLSRQKFRSNLYKTWTLEDGISNSNIFILRFSQSINVSWYFGNWSESEGVSWIKILCICAFFSPFSYCCTLW